VVGRLRRRRATCVLSLDGSVAVPATSVRKATTVSVLVGGPGTIVSPPKGSFCETGGKDTFVSIPEHGRRSPLVVELYPGGTLEDRIALFETPTSHG
jgi:hypothetical protein